MDRRSLLLGRRPAPAPLPAPLPAPDPAHRPISIPVPTAGGLAPFVPTADQPWDARRARHLLRRATLSATPAAVTAALGQTPAQAADALVDAALAAPMPSVPDYAALFPPVNPTGPEQTAYNQANSAGVRAEGDAVLRDLMTLRAPGTALRERLALAWHGVLTTNLSKYNQASRLYRYWAVLRRNALGSFETLVREVGVTPAMLVYLDGTQNRVGSPNENYAREVLELFTLGVTGPDGAANYTQADITNLARALTGWQTPSSQAEALFVPARFDAGSKTIFGQTGAFTYDTAHDVLFAQRRAQIAHHTARVLYQTFVAATPNETVVAELAGVLLANGLQIHAAVRALLQSQHLMSDGALGAQIKAPADALVGLVAELGWSNPEGLFSQIRSLSTSVGFELFRPPDVAGWSPGRPWLDTSRLPLRGIATDQLVARRSEARALVASLPGAGNSPYDLVDQLADRLVAIPLPAATRAEAVTILLGGIPDYEWDPTVSAAEGRIRSVLQFLARLPEYHLV